MITHRMLAAAAALSALFAAAPVLAHPKLVASQPAADTEAAAPAKIEVQFNEAVSPKFSKLELQRMDGSAVPSTPVDLPEGTTLAIAPAAPLAPGMYMVSWTAVNGTDGHKVQGMFHFSVK